MKQLRPLITILALVCLAGTSRAAEEPIPWVISAENGGEFDPSTSTFTATNGITVTYQDVVLSANKIVANEKTGDVAAEGGVTIKSAGNLWSGDRIYYNFKNRTMSAADFKTGRDPFFIKGDGLAGDQSNKVYIAADVLVTTDDYAIPAYKIRARKLKLVPGEYIEADHATLYLGDVPVFYFPHYHRSLKRHPNNFEFTPGYRSLYGPYLLSTYNWYHSEKLSGSVHMDLRERRGVAGGPDFHYNFGKWGDGDLEYYYAHDDDPGKDFSGRQLPTNRQRLRFQHYSQLDTNFTFKTAIRYQNDPFVVRDFFESEYRENVQPNSFADLNKAWNNWTFDLLAQPQINDFFETVERLPEAKLTGLRQQLGETPLFYDSESSAGYFQRKFASTNLFQPDFSAFRGDTYHQITLPKTYFGWLNVTPRVGGRFTYYTEAHGLGAVTHEEARSVFNTGAEISTKASRVWQDAENKLFDVEGLRHIFEPSINYVFVPEPNARPPELPQFDYELPSLRLLPIEFPDYNAIDSIDSQNVLRFTLRNKLQTKRGDEKRAEDRIENLINWALYTDWRLDPRTNQSTFADLFSDLDFRPRTWLTLNSETRFDIGRARWREANHRIAFTPNDRWSLVIGHRYLDEDPSLGPPPTGHNLIYDSFYYKFNENWAWRMSHYFEARDGIMQEQYYTIYRDLRSWTAALTVRLQDNVAGDDDFTIALTFSLKAFPRFRLNSDRDQPALLLGY